MSGRRGMMAGGGRAAVPDGYVTDGLVFFLDGKQLVSAAGWTDIIGGKTFALTNCSVGTNGIVFDGTAYGLYNGAVSSDWENETIEVVFSDYPITSNTSVALKPMVLVSQPTINNALGIGLRFGDEGNYIRIVMATDGVKRSLRQFAKTTFPTRIGTNVDRAIINEGNPVSNTSQTSYSANTSGKTVLGARTFTGDTVSAFYTGTIHAVRIYSRKLTEAEIKANQQNDATYYGL